MPRPYVLDSTLGAAFVGMLVAAILYGVSLVQAWYYYTHQNDSWPLKLLVGAVLIFDTTHQMLISHIVYTYSITNWGNPAILQVVLWSGSAEVIFNGLIALLVQSFLTRRVWRLSDRNKLLTGVIALLVLVEFVAVIALSIALQLKTAEELAMELKYFSIPMNALAVAGDILIAGALCIELHLSRTGFQRTDTIINNLILFAVNTGVLTSFCALASLIGILVAINTFIHVAFYFCLGRLYTNSLLATLNARKMIGSLGSAVESTNISLSRSEFPTTSAVGRRQLTNISITIDRTQEYATDEEDCIPSGLKKAKTVNSSIEKQEIESI